MEANKKQGLRVTEFFLRGKILFQSAENYRLNATHYFILKLPNKRELQQAVSNHSSDAEFKDLIDLQILY